MQERTDAPGTFCLVMTTLSSEEKADALARQLVQARLAACVQVQAVKSFYVWKEQPCTENEWLLFIKTRSLLYPALEAFIRAHHSYETPEIVQLPITAGSPDYLGWMAAQTGR